MGVTAESHDIEIAHRVPKRNVSDGPRPIICKFVRRLVRSEVIAARKEASKVSLEDIGLPSNSNSNMTPIRVLIVEHLTPKSQALLAEAKRF